MNRWSVTGWTAALLVCMSMLSGCAWMSRGETSPAERADIVNPEFLQQYAETFRFRLGHPASITVTPRNDAVLFLRSGPRSFERDLYEFDVRSGRERTLLTAEALLGGEEEELSPEELARRERMRLAASGIATYSLSRDGARILVPLAGDMFVYDRASGEITRLTSDAGFPIDPQFSNDGSRIGVVRDGDLYVMDIDSGREVRLTEREHDAITHGAAEFVAQEEMSRFHGFWWSPDDERIVYQRTDESDVETFYISDPSRPERPPQDWRYPRPGKDNASVELGVMRVPDVNAWTGWTPSPGETMWIQWDHATYPYLATVKWSKNGPLTILVQNRTQTEQLLLTVDEETGETSRLLVERDPAWINLDQSMPVWLPDDRGFLWTTERNGAWQLEHRASDGRLVRVLTSTDFGFRGFVHYQEETDEVVALASADSMETHGWRIPLKLEQGAPRRVTSGRGEHSAVFGDKGFLHVHQYNLLDGERGWRVLGRRGEVLGELTSVGVEIPFEINLELQRIDAGRVFDAAIIRPRRFDPMKQYPVLLSVYGGPRVKTVTATPRRYALHQWFADQGYIVVQIDGRGTPRQGRVWERAIRHDLISIPLADQAAALRALGQWRREMDLSRVGVYGWSFGGYFSAHAVLQRPDVFHAGVAGAPVTDWLDYDTHYTERYMGLPQENPDGYKRANAMTYAGKLERPLLMIHGTADDNVYFLHSLKLADELFRQGKPYEFIPLAGLTHMVTAPEATRRMYARMVRFFDQELK